ncbi:MAG: ribonuclease M5 [Bacillota bacterium]
MMKKIHEIIIVEGRDDTAAIRRGVDAATIDTHGYGIRPETWEVIDKAYKSKGIIIFTDPDTAGEQIRKRLAERYPEAKHAFLDRSLAEKDGDIGIENASPESIIEALEKARASAFASGTDEGEFAPADMFRWGLAGTPGAAERRRKAAEKLGVGMAGSKTFLRRLNRFGITREEIEEALK